jgi:hypothetical protein
MKPVLAIAVSATVALLLAQSPGYHITHTYTLGGIGSWDYVVTDPTILEPKSGKRVSTVPEPLTSTHLSTLPPAQSLNWPSRSARLKALDRSLGC